MIQVIFQMSEFESLLFLTTSVACLPPGISKARGDNWNYPHLEIPGGKHANHIIVL